MPATSSTTFAVSDVSPATRPLLEVPYKKSVESLLAFDIPDEMLERARKFEERFGMKYDLPWQPPTRPVEACTRYHGRLVAHVHAHPVLEAVHLAFAGHRPLTLSPDAVWLMIAQGVANHIGLNAEALRSRFVAHEGRAKLTVRRDDFVKGSPENPWPEMVASFCEKIREHVGSQSDLFVPDFSTTGPADRVAGQIVLMDAMQSYFEYVFATRCGIPSITLEGTTDDWASLSRRLDGFAGLGLDGWFAALRPILVEFARASAGEADVDFWRSIYKSHDMSGGPYITGWIAAFFPYLKDSRTGKATVPIEEHLRNRGTSLGELLLAPEGLPKSATHALTSSSIPCGLSKAPFEWEYLDHKFSMELLGGFTGIAQDPASLALRPEIGWAVREQPPEATPPVEEDE